MYSSAFTTGSLLAASSGTSAQQLNLQLLQLQQLGLSNRLGLEPAAITTDGINSLAQLTRSAEKPHSGNIHSDTSLHTRIAQILAASRDYDPVVKPDFPPLQVIMQLGTTLVPIIVERHTYEEARDFFQGESEVEEINKMEVYQLNPTMIEPMVFTLSTWNGTVHAIACCTVQPYRSDTYTMTCDKDLKFDRNRETSLKGVGPVLTLARLMFMKRRGYWQTQHSILMDIRPEWLARYRKHFPHPPKGAALDGWGIDAIEGNHMLTTAPFSLVELPLDVSDSIHA